MPWRVSASLMILAMVIILFLGLIIASFMAVDLSGWAFALLVTASLLGTFALLLSQYLRRSKKPFQ